MGACGSSAHRTVEVTEEAPPTKQPVRGEQRLLAVAATLAQKEAAAAYAAESDGE